MGLLVFLIALTVFTALICNALYGFGIGMEGGSRSDFKSILLRLAMAVAMWALAMFGIPWLVGIAMPPINDKTEFEIFGVFATAWMAIGDAARYAGQTLRSYLPKPVGK